MNATRTSRSCQAVGVTFHGHVSARRVATLRHRGEPTSLLLRTSPALAPCGRGAGRRAPQDARVASWLALSCRASASFCDGALRLAKVRAVAMRNAVTAVIPPARHPSAFASPIGIARLRACAKVLQGVPGKPKYFACFHFFTVAHQTQSARIICGARNLTPTSSGRAAHVRP